MKPGDRLGPYEILAPIGAGGMGEVYRARDTKLDRDVAIKVLPAALAQDPERLARFEREAKVLAALNHPNIAQIYFDVVFPDLQVGIRGCHASIGVLSAVLNRHGLRTDQRDHRLGKRIGW
jgi:serine/threonine protein kinase